MPFFFSSKISTLPSLSDVAETSVILFKEHPFVVEIIKVSLIKSTRASREAAEERPQLGLCEEQHTVINECPITLPKQETAPDCCKKDSVSTV